MENLDETIKLMEIGYSKLDTFVFTKECCQSEEQFNRLCSAIPTSNVVNIFTSVKDLDDQHLALFLKSLRGSKVEFLQVGDAASVIKTELGPGALDALRELLPTIPIKGLVLSGLNLQDADIKKIAPALAKTDITDLNLCFNHIGNEGAIALANAFSEIKSYKMEVSLYSNNISDDGGLALVQSRKWSTIQIALSRNIGESNVLDLGSNNISRGGREKMLQSVRGWQR
jgi:Leucine Rich repeat